MVLTSYSRPPECACPQSCSYNKQPYDQERFGIRWGTCQFDHDDEFWPEVELQEGEAVDELGMDATGLTDAAGDDGDDAAI